MKKKFKTFAPVMAIAALLVGLLTACADTATPTSSCAFVVNDGQQGRNSKIDHIAYPGDTINTKDKNVYFFPCNARNYIVNDGKQTDATGKRIGDRFEPAVGYTKEGTKVKIYYTMYWTLNQTEKVLEDSFYPFCFKYTCYSDNQSAGDSNFSTKGWNGMLGENFPQAADAVALRESKSTLTDASWKAHETTEWDALAKQLSENFSAEIRANTGVADDMFCGSGNSGWDNPSDPGKGKFTCTNVRFKVTSIVSYNDSQQVAVDNGTSAQIQVDQNTRLLDQAAAKYGDRKLAGYWLGLQDTLDKCAKSNITCVVTLGDNAPSINLPSPAK